MWIKCNAYRYINLNVMAELTIKKEDGIYELVVINATGSSISLCLSTELSEIFQVLDYIQTNLEGGSKFIDIKKFIQNNNLTYTIEPIKKPINIWER